MSLRLRIAYASMILAFIAELVDEPQVALGLLWITVAAFAYPTAALEAGWVAVESDEEPIELSPALIDRVDKMARERKIGRGQAIHQLIEDGLARRGR